MQNNTSTSRTIGRTLLGMLVLAVVLFLLILIFPRQTVYLLFRPYAPGLATSVSPSAVLPDSAIAGTYFPASSNVPGAGFDLAGGRLEIGADHRFHVAHLPVFSSHGRLICIVSEAGTWNTTTLNGPKEINFSTDANTIHIDRTFLAPPNSPQATRESNEQQSDDSWDQAFCSASGATDSLGVWYLMRKSGGLGLYRLAIDRGTVFPPFAKRLQYWKAPSDPQASPPQ